MNSTPAAFKARVSAGVAIPRESLQTAAISGLESDGNSGSHAPDSHASSQMGIPSGIQMSDAIPTSLKPCLICGRQPSDSHYTVRENLILQL